MTRKKITPATTVEQRLARPRETPDQRNARRLAQADATIAKATAVKVRAEFLQLAARAEMTGVAPRFVRAIRSMCDAAEIIGIDAAEFLPMVSMKVTEQESMIRRGQVSMGEIAEEPAA